MPNEINLLPKKVHSSANSAELSTAVKLLRMLAFLFIFFVPLTTIVLFLLIYFSPLQSLKEERDGLIAQTGQMQQKISEIQFITDRTNKANAFLSQQDKYDQIINTLTQLQQSPDSPQVEIQKLSISVLDGFLNLELKGPLLSLQQYQQNLMNLKNQHLSGLVFKDLTFDPSDDSYGLKVTVQVN